MEFPELVRNSRRAVMVTHRKNGSLQSSVITPVADPASGQILIWSRAMTAKTRNLARDPHTTLCVVGDDWRGWAHVDATVEIVRLPDALPQLEEYHRIREGKEHPNWEEYRQRMIAEERVLFRLTPERIFSPSGR